MADISTLRLARRLRIEGRVQGVWYRGWMVEAARARGLNGWVRNRRDGSVEAVISGTSTALDGLVQACWRGPPMARVDAITVTAEAVVGRSEFHQCADR